MATDKPTFDERVAALILDEDSAIHKALVEVTSKKSAATTSKSSASAKK